MYSLLLFVAMFCLSLFMTVTGLQYYSALTLLFLNQGIVRALQEYQQQLIRHKVIIFVRRGGPNYQEGLRVMREVGKPHCTFYFLFQKS
jgi:succinyl-CoA synthetase beta subunit